MNKEIKIKVIKLFMRFLKEKELYNDLIKTKKWSVFETFDKKNSSYFNINNTIENVSKLNITYFEGYAKHILNELGYTMVNTTILKIEKEWLNYCKTQLLKQNVNDIWELFKQTDDYKSNEHLIEKYNKNNIKNYQWSSYIQKECQDMDCVSIHAKYINDIMDLLTHSVNINIDEYQRLCNELDSYNLIKKWETFYENNVELKY